MTIETISDQLFLRNKVLPFISGTKFLNLGGIAFSRMTTRITEKNGRHERSHTLQQWELGIVGMWLLYGINWLINILYYWNFKKAYKMIAFELEANMNEDDEGYNTSRKHYAWAGYVRYIFKYSEIYGD